MNKDVHYIHAEIGHTVTHLPQKAWETSTHCELLPRKRLYTPCLCVHALGIPSEAGTNGMSFTFLECLQSWSDEIPGVNAMGDYCVRNHVEFLSSNAHWIEWLFKCSLLISSAGSSRSACSPAPISFSTDSLALSDWAMFFFSVCSCINHTCIEWCYGLDRTIHRIRWAKF